MVRLERLMELHRVAGLLNVGGGVTRLAGSNGKVRTGARGAVASSLNLAPALLNNIAFTPHGAAELFPPVFICIYIPFLLHCFGLFVCLF